MEGNLKLCDGHTIMMYLCDKYAAARLPHLYPCDYMARMEIQNMLFYEAGILYQLYSRVMVRQSVLKNQENISRFFFIVRHCFGEICQCQYGLS